MKNWKCFGSVMIIALTVLAVNANAVLLQNMELETDLTGWTIGAVDPLGTWDVEWSADHGGSAKMYITGAPAQTNISQVTQIPIYAGDQLTVNVYHSNMGNFSSWALIVDPGASQVLIYGADGAEGNYSLTWTADQYYDPGTLIVVSCSVWPGSSTTWVKNLVFTPKLALDIHSAVKLETRGMDAAETYYILCSDDMRNWLYLRGEVTTVGTNIHVETGGDSLVSVDGIDSETSIFIDTDHQQKQFYQITKYSPTDIVWVEINDPGVSGHEGFNGEMSRYETTNIQYCAFLNAALASGDITVSDSIVYGSNGSNGGADFLDEVYYDLAGLGYTGYGATLGGAARINWTGSSFTVDSGFDNHPVTYVSWYGSTAFASYYGWRLPTEWEWQAVADHTVADPYAYGCGPTINNSIANYRDSMQPDGTTVVGAFGTYGYGMCDMAGNVWEWTDSIYSGSDRVLRGGSWYNISIYCTVSYRHRYEPSTTYEHIGFRVCR